MCSYPFGTSRAWASRASWRRPSGKIQKTKSGQPWVSSLIARRRPPNRSARNGNVAAISTREIDPTKSTELLPAQSEVEDCNEIDPQQGASYQQSSALSRTRAPISGDEADRLA